MKYIEDELLQSAEYYLSSMNSKFIDKQAAQEVLISESAYLELEKKAKECRQCGLCETRNNVVFGAGRLDSPSIAFIGEGPGEEEDKTGLPFVGRAGELLTSAIHRGLRLTRDDVYICNVVKCRPPENRKPLPDEIKACVPYLFQQIRIIKPQVIVCLGGTAQKALTGIDEGILKLRGKWLEWEGVPVMPTVHPVYVLRNPSAKKDFWEDLKKVMELLGLR